MESSPDPLESFPFPPLSPAKAHANGGDTLGRTMRRFPLTLLPNLLRKLRCRTILFEDAVYLKGRELKGVMEARLWLETSPDFKEVTFYHENVRPN